MNKTVVAFLIIFIKNAPLHTGDAQQYCIDAVSWHQTVYLAINTGTFRPFQTESETGQSLHIPKNAIFTHYKPVIPRNGHLIVYKIDTSKIDSTLWRHKEEIDALELAATTLPAGSYVQLDFLGRELSEIPDDPDHDEQTEEDSRNTTHGRKHPFPGTLIEMSNLTPKNTVKKNIPAPKNSFERWTQSMSEQPRPFYSSDPYNTPEDGECCCCCVCCILDLLLPPESPELNRAPDDSLLTY